MLPCPLEPLIDRLGGSFSRDHQESGVTWGPGDHNGRPKFERLTSSRKSPGRLVSGILAIRTFANPHLARRHTPTFPHCLKYTLLNAAQRRSFLLQEEQQTLPKGTELESQKGQTATTEPKPRYQQARSLQDQGVDKTS